MISVKDARSLVQEHSSALPPQMTLLMYASGHTLAEDILATQDIPAFPQSSVDGYAIRFSEKEAELMIRGEMYAGAPEPFAIAPGQACRIFTGGPLPYGADTVVMQEYVTVSGDKLSLSGASIELNDHVRQQGAEIRADETAMYHGDLLTPAAIGFLAGIGVSEVLVHPAPKVSLLITGKELQQPGNPLRFGQVYESNSYSLTAALRQCGVTDITVIFADDHLSELTGKMQDALESSDLVLVTGGVSVGDHDHVPEAASRCGVTKVFHKVRQKPGKPLFFGTSGRTLLFGVPGNPSSVMSCFYNYVSPAIARLSQRPEQLRWQTAELDAGVKSTAGLTQFMKGTFRNGTATPLGGQESFRMRSFSRANCLIMLEETRSDYKKGDAVQIMLLPEFRY